MRQTKLCASQVGFIHDELQFECDPTHVNDLCSSLVYSATAAGEYYNMRIKIEAEATIMDLIGPPPTDVLKVKKSKVEIKSTKKPHVRDKAL